MDAKNFLKTIDSIDELKINGVNIFLKLTEGELKTLKYNYQPEKEFIDDTIIQEIKKYKNKTPKLYDTCKSKDEFFYLNLETLPKTEELIETLKEIESGKVIPECKECPEKIKYIVIEILTTIKKIFFIVDYEYNQFFKKKLLGNFWGECFKVGANSDKNIIINFSPKIIKCEDELIFNMTTPKILDLKNIFKNYIDLNIGLVNNILEEITTDKLNKNISTLLGRGILNGELKKFNDFSEEEKILKINEFKSKYKAKYPKASELIYSGKKIVNFHSLDAKEKEEVIKLITNRSALKILDGVLTTSLD